MKDLINEKDLPDIAVKARRAIKEAAAAAIAEHWRNGRPVYVWQNEQVVALYPDGSTVPVGPRPSKGALNG